jgi:hypothetical protein
VDGGWEVKEKREGRELCFLAFSFCPGFQLIKRHLSTVRADLPTQATTILQKYPCRHTWDSPITVTESKHTGLPF